MSTKHVRTTADVSRFGCSVKIECTGCGSARTVSGMELVRACGSVGLEAARQRLRCGRCNRRAARMVVLPPV